LLRGGRRRQRREAPAGGRGVGVDVDGMEIGAAVHAGGLQLPAGTTLAVDPEVLVLHVIAARTAEQIEAELGIEPAEGEGAEAAPPSPDAPDAPAAEDSGSEG
jgi:large subunit ribosomal protein L25